MSAQFSPTARTSMQRRAKRATYDVKAIHGVLDEALICAVAVTIDGAPHVQPMIHARIGSDLVLHGLASNRLLNAIASGAEVCINATIIDALSICRRIEDHSMLYRSATIYGRGQIVEELSEKQAIMERVFASLVGKSRLPALPALPDGYLAGTMIVIVPIVEAVGKVNADARTENGPEGAWSGLIPVGVHYGEPKPDSRTVTEGLAPPRDMTPRRAPIHKEG